MEPRGTVTSRAVTLAFAVAGLSFGLWSIGLAEGSATTVNSVTEIVGDMSLPHEGIPHGVPAGVDWRLGPRMGMGNDPGKFTAMTAWGQVYEDEVGNPATNTRVQLMNMRAYYLSKADGQWRLLQKSVGVEGAAYREDFADDVNQPAPAIRMKDGSMAIKAGNGFNYHFWPPGRKSLKKGDIAGIFTTIRARLIVDDPSKPDDREEARYLLSMGGDYWLNTSAGWDNFKTNGDIAIGRFKYVTKDWRAFNMTSVSEDVLRANPPPLE